MNPAYLPKMNENNTFLALRRVPYLHMTKIVTEWNKTHFRTVMSAQEMARYGWNWDDYNYMRVKEFLNSK
jgi:hypothetical protein